MVRWNETFIIGENPNKCWFSVNTSDKFIVYTSMSHKMHWRKWKRNKTKQEFDKDPLTFAKGIFTDSKSLTLKYTKEEMKDHVKETYSDPKIWEKLQYIEEATEDHKTRHSIWYVGFKGKRDREIHQQSSSKNARGDNEVSQKVYKKCPRFRCILFLMMRKKNEKKCGRKRILPKFLGDRRRNLLAKREKLREFLSVSISINPEYQQKDNIWHHIQVSCWIFWEICAHRGKYTKTRYVPYTEQHRTCVIHSERDSKCKGIEIRYIDDLVRFGKHIWFTATRYDRGSNGILLISRRVKEDDNEIP